jgi:hypothetical protein
MATGGCACGPAGRPLVHVCPCRRPGGQRLQAALDEARARAPLYSCLIESGGRWRLQWYLHWSFVCVRHGRLLLDKCPACGHVPRTRARWSEVRSPLTAIGCDPECSVHALTASPPDPLRPDHPVLDAQLVLDRILNGTRPIAASGGSRCPQRSGYAISPRSCVKFSTQQPDRGGR